MSELIAYTPEEKGALAQYSPEWQATAVRWQMALGLAQRDNGACPDALRGKPGAIFQVLSIGAEVGLPPMTALMHLYVVHGKVGMDAQSMRGLVRARGHVFRWVERTSESCTAFGKRKDGEEMTVTWTIEDAQAAGLIKGDSAWETYPRAMLAARATAELCRALFEDVLGAIAYTPEELRAEPAAYDLEEE